MSKEILFSESLAAEVRRRVDLWNKHQVEINNWLDTVMTVAAEQGGASGKRVAMNAEMTGVVVVEDEDGGKSDDEPARAKGYMHWHEVAQEMPEDERAMAIMDSTTSPEPKRKNK